MAIRPPKLRELDAFRTLLRVRSVTEAAHLLGVSQPAVSKSLRQLEDRLGFRLFERIGGRLHPTPEAEALVPALEGVFASVSALTDTGQAIRDGRAGQVMVGAIPTLANVVLPPAIEAATARHSGLRVSVQILPTRPIVDAVARGVVELGLVHDILDDPLVQVENLGAAGMACVVPEGHPLAGRRIIEARDLRGLPYVSYAAQSPIGLRIALTFGEVGESFAPAVEVGASTAVCAIALRSGIPGLVEDYVLSLGWWPGLRMVPIAPPIPLRPRLLTTLQRPIPVAARTLAAECRRVVMETLERQAWTQAAGPGRSRRS